MTQNPSIDLVDETVRDTARVRPDLDPRAVEMVCRIIYSGRKMEIFAAKTLRSIGLNYTDLDVLGSLYSAKEENELTPAQLMRSAMISSGAMSICLNRLETKQLIVRRTDLEDRRVRRISLTKAGRDLIDRAFTLRFGRAEALAKGLSEDEARQLNILLRKVTDRSDQLLAAQ